MSVSISKNYFVRFTSGRLKSWCILSVTVRKNGFQTFDTTNDVHDKAAAIDRHTTSDHTVVKSYHEIEWPKTSEQPSGFFVSDSIVIAEPTKAALFQ
jgi:hypothetical protein